MCTINKIYFTQQTVPDDQLRADWTLQKGRLYKIRNQSVFFWFFFYFKSCEIILVDPRSYKTRNVHRLSLENKTRAICL